MIFIYLFSCLKIFHSSHDSKESGVEPWLVACIRDPAIESSNTPTGLLVDSSIIISFYSFISSLLPIVLRILLSRSSFKYLYIESETHYTLQSIVSTFAHFNDGHIYCLASD